MRFVHRPAFTNVRDDTDCLLPVVLLSSHGMQAPSVGARYQQRAATQYVYRERHALYVRRLLQLENGLAPHNP